MWSEAGALSEYGVVPEYFIHLFNSQTGELIALAEPFSLGLSSVGLASSLPTVMVRYAATCYLAVLLSLASCFPVDTSQYRPDGCSMRTRPKSKRIKFERIKSVSCTVHKFATMKRVRSEAFNIVKQWLLGRALSVILQKYRAAAT
jgi:hypothetical protein